MEKKVLLLETTAVNTTTPLPCLHCSYKKGKKGKKKERETTTTE